MLFLRTFPLLPLYYVSAAGHQRGSPITIAPSLPHLDSRQLPTSSPSVCAYLSGDTRSPLGPDPAETTKTCATQTIASYFGICNANEGKRCPAIACYDGDECTHGCGQLSPTGYATMECKICQSVFMTGVPGTVYTSFRCTTTESNVASYPPPIYYSIAPDWLSVLMPSLVVTMTVPTTVFPTSQTRPTNATTATSGASTGSSAESSTESSGSLPPKQSSNVPTIAGVVGAVAFVALASAIGFFVYRRRKSRKPLQNLEPNNAYTSNYPAAYYLDTKGPAQYVAPSELDLPPPRELDSTPLTHELPDSQRRAASTTN